MLYRITTNSRPYINNGARFYTIKILWFYVKVKELSIKSGYGDTIIKTLKFDDIKEAKKVLRKLNWWSFRKTISWRELLDVKYFY